MFGKILKYAKKYRFYAVMVPVTIICEVLLEIRIPILMAKIVDIGIENHDISYVMKTGAMMIVISLLSLIFGALAALWSARAAMGFGSQLRKALFDKIQELSFANLDKFSNSSLLIRLTTDVNNTQNAFGMVLRILARSPVMLVSATFMAYRINAGLVKIFLIAIPFLGLFLALIAYSAYPRFMTMLKRYDDMNGSVQENLIAIRVVKSFVRAGYEKLKFKAANNELLKASIKAERILILSNPLMFLTMYSCIVAILWFGGNMIVAGTMLTGELISFVAYVTNILISLMMISMVFIMIILSRASISRIVQVLEEEPDINDDNADGSLEVADGSIIFKDVSFKYDTQAESFLLEKINLKINSGETVGIIGGTGSAKTTLVQLIPRLYDVLEGRILVGGRDVREYTLSALRKDVAMVLQKNVLFSGTIEDNLRWGNPAAGEDIIRQAAEAACAHEFIESFPAGYQTQLGQGGVNVSGGQKQRLSIARALLKKPKIIILDDSTSAVDTVTDASIRKRLKEDLKGTTTIIIAQRINSVADADKIIVMDDGKIVDIGSHEELLAGNEIYREIYHSQQKGVA